MPNNETLGGSFSLDVTQLKAGLAQANRLIRESESEFKAAAAGMDDWRESQEGLQARIKHLNNACDLQRKKVDALQGEYDRLIADGLDPTSAAAVKLRTDINKEKEALAKNESELRKQTQALEDLAEESDDTADKLKDVGDAAEDAGDGFTVAKGAVAGFIANGLSSLVGAAKNAISSVLELAESTKEFRQNMAKLETGFVSAGHSADDAANTYKELYSILGDTGKATEAAAFLAQMTTTQEGLATWTDIAAGVYATFGDSLPIESLAEAANETAKTGQLTGALADALNWVGLSEEEFQKRLDECSTESERAYVINEQLVDSYYDQAEAFKENNASIIETNKAQARHAELTASLGEKIEPITTKVRNGFNSILEKVLELTEGVDMEGFGEKIDAAFDTFCDDVLPAIQDGLQWIIDNKNILIAGIAGIGAAFAAFKVVSLIQGVVSALNGMTLAQAALNLVMSMNPIGLVVAAIAGLVAAFVVLWNKCDAFREFWVNLWDGIKKTAKSVADWFVQAWSDVGKFFSDMWSGFTDGAKKAWQGVKDTFSAVATFFGNIFRNAWDGVKKVFSTGGKIFDGIKDGIVKAFKTVVNAIIKGINKVVKLPFVGLNNILDKLTGLSIAGLKPFNWLTWRAPVPQLPMLAEGGVVRKATTAIIGEDGAEAVVPLEKNTGWIKKLAAEIAAQQPQGVVVNQTNNYSQAHSRVELYKTKQATAAAVRLAMAGA